MVRKASGEARVGARLDLHYEPEGLKKRNFKPVLMFVEPGRELRWKGRPEIRFLVESEHIFILTESEDEKTHLDHDMIFYGLLIPLRRNIIEKSIRKPFNDVNKAMKERVEGRNE